MDADAYRRKLEADVLKIMEEKLLTGEMDAIRAKAIARMLLDRLHPPLTLEQIHQIAPTLDDQFQELTVAILPVVHDHEEEVKKIVAEHAEKLIKIGNTMQIQPTTVTQKGQVTIPVEIRKLLRLKTGDQIKFTVKKKVIQLKPARKFSIMSLYGSLKPQVKPNLSGQDLIKWEEQAWPEAAAEKDRRILKSAQK